MNRASSFSPRHRPASSVAPAVAALFVALLVGACEKQPESRPPSSKAQALHSAFEKAASRWNVPDPLLKAIGYTASRWHHPPLGSTAGRHGLMQLSDEAVTEASRLTSLPENLIREDPSTNIQAAAALIGRLGDESIPPGHDRVAPEQWWDVLLSWSEARSGPVAEWYAASVLRTIIDGAHRTFDDGSTLRLEGAELSMPEGLSTSTWGQGGTDYPNATWVPADSSNHSTGRNETVDRIILTTAGASASSAINTFQDPDSNRSVHYLVHWNGDITQLVREENAAWHSSCYNHRSIGIMFEGFITEPDNYTNEMYEAGSALVRWLTTEHGLDRTDKVIIGHSDVDCGDGVQRYSPGQHFDWYRFLAKVNNSLMMGEVFFGDDFWADVHRDDNRLEDALVWLDTGQVTMSEGALGRFQFLVPPGTYQVTAEADGYEPGTRSCDVLPEQTTWCSVMVTEIEDPDPDPDPTQGTLAGIVVWGHPDESPFDIIANHQDTRFVAGATVTITPGPITVTTGDDGFYRVDVDPGTYTIEADADDYEPREAALGPATVDVGETVYRSVMVIEPPPTAPQVIISEPDAGQVFDAPEITVAGRVEHDKPIVSTTVNGDSVSLSNGDFSTTVTIPPGPSTITVSATDEDGVTGTAAVGVTYQTEEPDPSGVDGFVWDSVQGMGAPIEGATIRVGQTETTSESDGWFTMDKGPGTYALLISAEGYIDHVDQVFIPIGGRAELLIALDPEGADVGPEVTIVSPEDHAVVHEPDVLVEGTVDPDDADITVTINGIAANYSAGAFSGVATLSLGSNAILVRATDGQGRTGSAAITVVYEEETEPEPTMSGVDGFVFDGLAGPSSPIAGAVVTIGDAQATTDSEGAFSLDVLSGPREVTATASGYEDYQSTLDVPAEQRGTIEIGMTPIEDEPGPDLPVVEITFPAEGEVISTPTVMVTGRILHEDVEWVTVNDLEAELGPTDGFTAEISLEPGENDILALAFDAFGVEMGRALVTVQHPGAGTGGCSCSTSSPGQGLLGLLCLLSLCVLRARRRRP